MRFAEPLADGTAPLARREPIAKLAAAAILTFALVISLDPVAPAVAFAVVLASVPFFGVRYLALVRRFWPVLASATAAALTYLLFAARTGEVLAAVGPVEITPGLLSGAASLVLRLLALALPGLLVFATTDPTDLADSLVQHARVSARFAIGALAAFRLLPLLADDWEMLTLARRARGVDAGRNPLARLRLFGSTLFALLVGAIRRGTRLAVAMDARGFDSGRPRSVARVRRFSKADAMLIIASVALAGIAVAASVWAGTFRPLLR